MINSAKTGCDFFGHTAFGRTVLIEAKMLEKPSLGIGPGGAVKPHQWLMLWEGLSAGCIATIVWQRGEEIGLLSPYRARCIMEENLQLTRKSVPWKLVHLKCKASVDEFVDLYLDSYSFILKPGCGKFGNVIVEDGEVMLRKF